MSLKKIEFYDVAKPGKGEFIVDKAYELLPSRYWDADIVNVTIDNEWCGYKMFPKQCRVEAKELPLFKPNMPENGFWNVGEIEKWIDATVEINELTIDFDACIKENFEEVKDNIYINLQFTEKAREYIPYKKFHMFCIIYQLEVVIDEIRFRITIENPMLEQWGITVEELHEIAMENSLRDKPAILRTYRDSVNMENYNLLNDDEPITPERTYVLENAESFFSVGLLAYPGVLEKVAEILGDNFYFYAKNPSYIYITAKNENYDGTLVKLPKNWNPSVYWEDAFSPSVYEYHRESGEITW